MALPGGLLLTVTPRSQRGEFVHQTCRNSGDEATITIVIGEEASHLGASLQMKALDTTPATATSYAPTIHPPYLASNGYADISNRNLYT
jgi:hypothetical protein